MTIAEIAQKFGVPMPETCKELDWMEETHFCWVQNKYGFVLSIEDTYNDVFLNPMSIDSTTAYHSQMPTYYKAPQIHELLAVIPNKINKPDLSFYINQYEVGYTLREFIAPFPHIIVNGTFATKGAQMLAELYLKLKQEGLL